MSCKNLWLRKSTQLDQIVNLEKYLAKSLFTVYFKLVWRFIDTLTFAFPFHALSIQRFQDHRQTQQ